MTPPDRLTLRSIAADFARDVSQAEKGLWGTIVQLTLRPRRVVDTFLFQDRGRFSRPTRYLIFCLSIVAFHALAKEWRYGDQPAVTVEVTQSAPAEADEPTTMSEFERGMNDSKKNRDPTQYKALNPYLGYLSAMLIPVYAFLYGFLFSGRKFNYAESLAAATYLHAHYMLLTGGLAFALLLFPEKSDYLTGRSMIRWAGTVFLLWSVVRVLRTSRKGTGWFFFKLLMALPWLIFPVMILGSILIYVIDSLSEIETGAPTLTVTAILMLVGGFGTWFFGRQLDKLREGWPGWGRALPILLWALLVYVFTISLIFRIVMT